LRFCVGLLWEILEEIGLERVEYLLLGWTLK
jgi:hypothetical protein